MHRCLSQWHAAPTNSATCASTAKKVTNKSYMLSVNKSLTFSVSCNTATIVQVACIAVLVQKTFSFSLSFTVWLLASDCFINCVCCTTNNSNSLSRVLSVCYWSFVSHSPLNGIYLLIFLLLCSALSKSAQSDLFLSSYPCQVNVITLSQLKCQSLTEAVWA